ncbi:Plant invertase/pectin methylesterase inhibitor superfamily protein [Abeliophyllum distichum]|uniref:Plant invertase/pectin methylesterase inhibitor superfamily protein n=1 Tax=Abeliophyllum distichum TaxID=126358 RepID=A0ABD1NUD4_9LAMI
MAPKKFNYFSLFFLTLVALLLAQSTTTEARKFIGVNPFCTTASHKKLCTKMVNGATNMHDATQNAIQATLGLAKKIQSMSRLIEPAIANLEPVSQESIRSTCKESFENTIDDLETSLQALKDNDQGTLLTHLSAATSSDCDDALTEFGVDNPLSKVSGILAKEVDNCLAVVQQI